MTGKTMKVNRKWHLELEVEVISYFVYFHFGWGRTVKKLLLDPSMLNIGRNLGQLQMLLFCISFKDAKEFVNHVKTFLTLFSFYEMDFDYAHH